jgi:hypothetical protein
MSLVSKSLLGYTFLREVFLTGGAPEKTNSDSLMVSKSSESASTAQCHQPVLLQPLRIITQLATTKLPDKARVRTFGKRRRAQGAIVSDGARGIDLYRSLAVVAIMSMQ